MKKKKVYSKDFKLHVVKGYQNRRKSLKDFSNKYYIYQLTLFNNGFKGKKDQIMMTLFLIPKR